MTPYGVATINQSTESFVYASMYTPSSPDRLYNENFAHLVQSDHFDYQVEFNGVLSAIATVYVETVNSTPTVQNDYVTNVQAQHPTGGIGDFTFTLPFTDDAGDQEIATIVPGSISNMHVYSFDPSTGNFQYEPAIDPGLGSFKFTMTDEYGATSTIATFQEYTAIPDRAPVANNDVIVLPSPDELKENYSINPGDPLHIPIQEGPGLPQIGASVLANDTDPDGDALTGFAPDRSPRPSAILVTPPKYAAASAMISGTLYSPGFVLYGDGTFVYVPGPNFHGTDYFTYVASDGLEDSGIPETGALGPGETPLAREFKNVASVTLVSSDDLSDLDGDGRGDFEEEQGANQGDANGDGIPDFLEPNVSQGPILVGNGNGSPGPPNSPVGLAIVAPDETIVNGPYFSPPPTELPAPPNVLLPVGYLDFGVSGFPAGHSAAGTYPEIDMIPIFTPPQTAFEPVPDAYYKYEGDWVPFPLEMLDPNSGAWVPIPPNMDPNQIVMKTGAVISDSKITLYLVDNARGDDDSAPNSIYDPAALAYYVPVPSFVGATVGVREQPMNFTLTAADLSAVKLAAGVTYTINWGDGSPIQTIARVAGDGSGVPVNHVFSQVGTYAVKVTTTDEYGMSGAPITVPVAIHAVAVEPDPLAPHEAMLAVGGTAGRDVIRVLRAPHGGVTVRLDGARLGSFDFAGRIAVYGGPGNDDIRLGAGVRQSAWLYGGAGNDVLISGAGSDVLVAGSGRDVLFGGAGRNVLVAGSGQDRLIGSRGRDLVVRQPAVASNDKSLAAILAGWVSLQGTRHVPRIPNDRARAAPTVRQPTRPAVSSVMPAARAASGVAALLERAHPAGPLVHTSAVSTQGRRQPSVSAKSR